MSAFCRALARALEIILPSWSSASVFSDDRICVYFCVIVIDLWPSRSWTKEQYDKDGVIKRAIEEAGIDHKSWLIDKIETRKWHTSMKLKKRISDKPGDYIEEPHQIVNWLVGIKLKPNDAKPYMEA